MPTHRFTHTVDYSREQVWNWFAQPGAMLRLAPPWSALQPQQQAKSLRDGTAILRVTALTKKVPGVEWVAQHQPDDYKPDEQFVDECVSEPFAAMTNWRHVHRFADQGHQTEVIDEVTARVPRRVIAPIFAFRSRQLTDDLAAHADAIQRWQAARQTIAITGSNGLVGSALCAFLSTGGHHIVQLVRGEPANDGPYEQRHWDQNNPDPTMLDGVDTVIHLAGEPIGSRFTEKHMAAVRDSRVGPTRALAEEIARHGGPKVFVSASAIGYYGADHGDEVLDESSPAGTDFLASVVQEWEDATRPARDAGVRTVQVRTGIVQSGRGGTLALLRPLFETFLGGRLGSGQQWMSWIGLDDLVDVYHQAVFDAELDGPVNAVAPQAIRNDDYSKTLAHVLSRPSLLPVPAFGPELLLGTKGAEELALASQRVKPAVLERHGHSYRFADLEDVLRHELGRVK